MRKPETLIGRHVLCVYAMNLRFGIVVHDDVTLLLAVVLLDLKHL